MRTDNMPSNLSPDQVPPTPLVGVFVARPSLNAPMTFDDELLAKLKADEPKREIGVCVKFLNEAGYGSSNSMTIPAPTFSFTSEIASTKCRSRSTC
jgi:hypothetical protein